MMRLGGDLVAVRSFEAWDGHGHATGRVEPGTRLINCAPAVAAQLVRAGLAVPVDDVVHDV